MYTFNIIIEYHISTVLFLHVRVRVYRTVFIIILNPTQNDIKTYKCLIFISYKNKNLQKQKRHCKMIKQSITFRLFYRKLIIGRKIDREELCKIVSGKGQVYNHFF